MTSTTDMAGHPDVSEISDLTEGLLPPARGADVRRHVDRCEMCADVHASLEEIRGLLGSLQGPPRMPEDVAARIDAALAAEAAEAAEAPEAQEPAVTAGAAVASDEDAERHVSRETSTAPDRPAGRPRAAAGPGRKKSERGRRRNVTLGAVLTAAVLGAGTFVLQSLGSDSADTTAHGKPTATVGTFSGGSVQSQVKSLLSAQTQSSPSRQPRSGVDSQQNSPGSTESAKTLLQPEAPVPDCVQKAINRSGDVLGSKTGTYGGKAAYLVVLPDAHDNTRVTAYVVDAACVGQQPDGTGKVLLKQSFTRS
ncbi:hypothetical protein [Streptomyces sp. L2]|uniref:hypothetical protein n=1 Tax=Streptomyces sp. L2 TaxID=2162665 RepID=UPI001011176E|nr:hypothetical protein [Streptomyces sp. L2]